MRLRHAWCTANRFTTHRRWFMRGLFIAIIMATTAIMVTAVTTDTGAKPFDPVHPGHRASLAPFTPFTLIWDVRFVLS